ncbi:MAG: thioredoxin domain-containing protein [Chryseobacterium sp.]
MKNIINISLASICLLLIFLTNKKNENVLITKENYNQEKIYTAEQINDYKEILSAANKSNQKILLVFFSKWCIPCQKMEHEVFSTSKIKNKIKQKELLNLTIDIDLDKNKEIVSKYNVKAIPFYAIIDKKENIVKKDEGFKGSREFNNWLD